MTTPTRRIAFALLVAIAIMIAAAFWFWPRPRKVSIDYKMPGNPGPKIAAAQAAAIERRERVVDQTVWRKEIEAQEYGRVFEDFWDALNAATNKWEVVSGLKFEAIRWGRWETKEDLGHGIDRWLPATVEGEKKLETRHFSYEEWKRRIENWSQSGWRIMQCEFRHNAFDPQTNDIPARSGFWFSAHLTNASPARAVVEGDLAVEWKLRETNSPPQIAKIDASGLQVMLRAGPPAFVQVLDAAFDAPDFSVYIEPLNVYDLDGDGLPEIILPALNRVFRRNHDGGYAEENLYPKQRLQVLNGLFADFDGDGVTDFLYVEFDGVFLIKGDPGGNFQRKPQNVSGRLDGLGGPRGLTCGDIDGDGDLDVFVSQYKGPFGGGSFPTPYYDANDAYPAFLLLNDGHGNFKDATEAAGLAAKRFRRTLAASFVDLDGDGALDLLVTSDFAGADVYRGDHHGHFRDVTKDWLPETHAFGMGHTLADFNNDGRIDFIMAGMTSPTVDRLDHLRLSRPSSKLDGTMRSKMAYGSRLYLGGEDGRFLSTKAESRIARSGWSWGISAADFDNDGWPDVYVANGMESFRTVRDYESEFWLHDIFVGNSIENPVSNAFFVNEGNATRGRGMSYGGFDKNRLYLNRECKEFVDVAHLFGVASEEDSRNLVAADLNGDGKVDLVFTTMSVNPPYKQRLHIYENQMPEMGNWIELSFAESPGRLSPIGARATLRAGAHACVQQIVTGDSFRSQHPLNVHFGLGALQRVDFVDIVWSNRQHTRLANPKLNSTTQILSPSP